MAMNAGDSACSTGLSKRIFDQWSTDPSSGFSSPLTGPQEATVKALCWAIAKSVVDEVVANSQVIHSGSPTGDTVR